MAAFKEITSGSNMQDVDYIREIERGIYERFQACGASGCPSWATATGTTTAGTNIQSASFWSARQQALSTLISNGNYKYIKGATDATTISNGLYNNNLSQYTSVSQLWNDVTGNSYPRRYTTNLTSVSYGYCQTGDVLYLEKLIEDLQNALKKLSYIEVGAEVNKVDRDGSGTEVEDWWQFDSGEDFSGEAESSGWGSTPSDNPYHDAAVNYNADLSVSKLIETSKPHPFIDSAFLRYEFHYVTATHYTSTAYCRCTMDDQYFAKIRTIGSLPSSLNKTYELYARFSDADTYDGPGGPWMLEDDYGFYPWHNSSLSYNHFAKVSSYSTTDSICIFDWAHLLDSHWYDSYDVCQDNVSLSDGVMLLDPYCFAKIDFSNT